MVMFWRIWFREECLNFLRKGSRETEKEWIWREIKQVSQSSIILNWNAAILFELRRALVVGL